MIAERGSGTGAGGTDVMPAPSCRARVRVEPSRLVGRVAPARAEPMGELDSREALLVRVLPVRAVRLLGVEPLTAGLLAGVSAGVPQTLQ
jgi:hypothetical protein